jgi:hypothetical protein
MTLNLDQLNHSSLNEWILDDGWGEILLTTENEDDIPQY